MMATFYAPFHTPGTAGGGESGERPEDNILGTDPASGKPVIARLGRFGPMLQLGAREDEDKKFAQLPPGTMLHNVSL